MPRKGRCFHVVAICVLMVSLCSSRRKNEARDFRTGPISEGMIPTAPMPDLGRFAKEYTADKFLASGGQASVYLGREISTQRQVVLRFPRGMCSSSVCLVHELDEMTLGELRSSCALAGAATGRYIQQSVARKQQVASIETSPFVECLKPVSNQDSDPAFEVWSYVGAFSLTDGLFLNSSVGVLPLEQKRLLLAKLRDAIGILAHPWLEWDRPCCCRHSASTNHKEECSAHHVRKGFNLFSACPSGYIDSPSSCGPIVHHDIKFENVMLRYEHVSFNYTLTQHNQIPLPQYLRGRRQDAGISEVVWNRNLVARDADGHTLRSDLHDLEHLAEKQFPVRISCLSQVQPVVIDFGAASRCDHRRAAVYSPDWFPFWLKDKMSNPSRTCWGYDTYGVGLAWLVVELLAKVSPLQLLTAAATDFGHSLDDGCVGLAMDRSREPSMCALRLLDRARNIVDEVVHSVSTQLLHRNSMRNVTSFTESVSRFVRERSKVGHKSLPFTTPPKLTLAEVIYPMLQECPPSPVFWTEAGRIVARGRRGRYEEIAQQLQMRQTKKDLSELQCLFGRASQELHSALAAHDIDLQRRSVIDLQLICKRLKSLSRLPEQLYPSAPQLHAELQEQVTTMCDDNQAKSIIDFIVSDNVDGLRHMFEAAIVSGEDAHDLFNRIILGGESIITTAARAGSPRVIDFLLSQANFTRLLEPLVCSEVDGMHGGGALLPPILAAASRPGNVEVLRMLLKSSSVFTADALTKIHACRGAEGRLAGPSLVSIVAESGDTDMLKLVLELIRPPSSKGQRARKYSEVVARTREPAISAMNAPADSLTIALRGVEDGHVPLLRAAAAGRSESCRLLISAGADFGAVDSFGRDPLVLAVESSSSETVQVIATAFPQALLLERPTPCLHVAAASGDASMVSVLLDLGADPAKKDATGKTPMHAACLASAAGLPVVQALGAYAKSKGHLDLGSMSPSKMCAYLGYDRLSALPLQFLRAAGAPCHTCFPL